MHNVAVVATLEEVVNGRAVKMKRVMGIATFSLLFAIGGYHGIANAVDDNQMEMPMDHSQHQMDHSQHQMDHSQHQMDMSGMDHSQHQMDMSNMDHADHAQHTAMLKNSGKFARSVATYAAPNVRMLDMDGEEVALQSALSADKPLFLNFIFTTCTTICPVMSASFEQVQDLLGKESSKVRMVSISIDPENDTPANLKLYAGKYNAGSQWTMLTGTVADSIAVQKAYGVYSGDKMNHQPVTFLKAKGSANSWVRLDGLVDAADIVKEYRKLKAK